MTHVSQHEIVFTLDVTEERTKTPRVWAVVKKPISEEGATATFPYVVWVANNREELQDSSTRQAPSSSVESLRNAIRMFFAGNATYVLSGGLSFTLDELLVCESDNSLLELIRSKSE